MKLIGSKNGFDVYFNCDEQMYIVFKDNREIRKNIFKFINVRAYLD